MSCVYVETWRAVRCAVRAACGGGAVVQGNGGGIGRHSGVGAAAAAADSDASRERLAMRGDVITGDTAGDAESDTHGPGPS